MRKKHLKVVYILPSTYDDEGYVVRHWRGVLPSNTLCCLRTLTVELAKSGELDDVEVTVETYDDAVQRIPTSRILRQAKGRGTQVVVGLVGVQSNQFPRAADLALEFRRGGVPVLIGGFHVSGILALFEKPTPDLQDLIDSGISIVRGEAEAPGVLAGILRDALDGGLKPIYDIAQPPDIATAPVPQPDLAYLRRFVFKNMGTIDTSRGCPFQCSFCTIINVQGKKMRWRSAAAILESIEKNYERGINLYFFTDDNFSRSPVWEELLDGLIERRRRGIHIRFMMQVDTQAWKIPRFVEKATAAGCYLVFIGMESVNQDNLNATGKKQNKAHRFAEMVATWHNAGVLVQVGYIIGMPHDTPESVRRDVETLRNQIKVDDASFFMMIALPGSQDHLEMVRRGAKLEEDYNIYDGCHETFVHPNFAPNELETAFHNAWEAYYGKESTIDVLLRTPASSYWQTFRRFLWNRYSTLIHRHPMATGFIRLKDRKSRRPTFPRESRIRYLWRRAGDALTTARIYLRLFFEFQEIWLLTREKEDPRWAVLADLRARWLQVQQRISESDVAARCDVAAVEFRSMLRNATERLRQLGGTGKTLSRHARTRLGLKVKEIEDYLRAFEVQIPSLPQVGQAERYIADSLLAGYEELAIRYVAQRRRLNAYRQDLVNRLKKGRLLSINVLSLSRAVVLELFLGLRFGMAFLYQLQKTGG